MQMKKTHAATARIVAEMFKALGHTERVRVMMLLLHHGPLSVTLLCDALDVEQSAMSHHLRLLRDCRLVEAQRVGKAVEYRLADTHVATMIGDAVSHTRERKRDA
jgi:DNA-binding transcriptional ArsR family regulator